MPKNKNLIEKLKAEITLGKTLIKEKKAEFSEKALTEEILNRVDGYKKASKEIKKIAKDQLNIEDLHSSIHQWLNEAKGEIDAANKIAKKTEENSKISEATKYLTEINNDLANTNTTTLIDALLEDEKDLLYTIEERFKECLMACRIEKIINRDDPMQKT